MSVLRAGKVLDLEDMYHWLTTGVQAILELQQEHGFTGADVDRVARVEARERVPDLRADRRACPRRLLGERSQGIGRPGGIGGRFRRGRPDPAC